MEEAKKAVAAKERQLSEKKARIQVIQNMERDHDGFSRGVKTILQSKAGWRSGICGVVGELLHVEGRYVTAIETALGGALQNIITRDAQTAKEAIRHLKSQKGGRATFLPLDTIRPRSLSPKEKKPSRHLVSSALPQVSFRSMRTLCRPWIFFWDRFLWLKPWIRP